MFFLEFLLTMFLLIGLVSITEMISNSVFNKSFISEVIRIIKSINYSLFKKKTAYSMLSEILRQTQKYSDKYSVWNKKVSEFQVHYYYEIEKIVDFLNNTNDEVMAEFNSTYRETVDTIYKLMKETEFIISKKHHGELLLLLNEIKADIKDIHEITNSVKVAQNSELVSIEMDYVMLQRQKRQMMKED